jgi:hypothetical protein
MIGRGKGALKPYGNRDRKVVLPLPAFPILPCMMLKTSFPFLQIRKYKVPLKIIEQKSNV